ncbi:MAG: carbonic anhydrase, partial [Actinomycetes bacterium]
VAAEIIFDQGLGDLFVVRTAGHVVGPGVLGTLEFGSALLDIPLIVVLGHDSCGAVAATLDAMVTGEMPGGFLRDLVERVTPSLLAVQRTGEATPEKVLVEHVKQTGQLLVERSQIVREAVSEGRCAVVGLVYALTDGRVSVVNVIGDLDTAAPSPA